MHKVNAKYKVAWNHTDYATQHPNPKLDRRVYTNVDYVVSVSESCTVAFRRMYPAFSQKAVTVENCLARELIERYRAFERTSRWALSAAYETCFSGFADVPRLGCVVMASGEGTRFGCEPGEKLVAPLAGTAVLERTLSALPADLLDVVVVTRWDAVEALCARLSVRCVRAAGPLKSDTMRAGLEALGHRAGCLFVTGDQPLLGEKSVRAMVAALTHEPTAIVRLAWHGRAANPVLWPNDTLGALAQLEGDTGGRVLLDGHAELEGRVRLVEAASEWELADVDMPEDLTRLEAALADKT